jgi:hypothetical protein
MTITVTHAFTSGIADDPVQAGQGKVLPSHWNASHVVSDTKTIESFGASPGASPTTNYTAIQAALNAGGQLSLLTPGTYQINAELQIGDNTDLYLGPNVIIQCAAANMNLISTKAMHIGDASVSLSWSSDTQVTVTWNGHGLVEGDPVVIAGANQSYFNGCFLVETRISANQFTYRTARLPATAPTGTIVARKGNTRVWIRGGTWDRNFANFGSTELTGAAIRMGYAYDSGTENVRLINTAHFGIDSGALRSVTFRHTSMDTNNGDGIKVYGPAFDVHVEGIYGNTGDDAFSFHTKEFAVFINYRWTFGDIIGCTVKNIFANAGLVSGNTAACYISTNELMDQVHYEGIYGTAPVTGSNAFNLAGDNPANVAGVITVRKVAARSLGGSSVTINNAVITRLALYDIEVIPGASVTPGTNDVAIGTTASIIGELLIDGFSIPAAASWTGGPYWMLSNSSSVIKHLVVRNQLVLTSSQFGGILAVTNVTHNAIDVYNPYVNTATARFIYLEPTVLGTPKINIFGGNIQGTPDGVVVTQSACTILIAGLVVNAVGNGVVFVAGAVAVSGTIVGSKLLTGTNWVLGSGGPTLSITRIDDSGQITNTTATAMDSFTLSGGGIGMIPQSLAQAFIGQVGNSYIQFDKPGVVGLFDWSSGTAGTFSGGSRTPAQITSNQDNYNPGGYAYLQRWSTNAALNVTGLTFTNPQENGQTHIILNIGSFSIVLKHDVTSTPANRFFCAGAVDITVPASRMAIVIYDSAAQRWWASLI